MTTGFLDTNDTKRNTMDEILQRIDQILDMYGSNRTRLASKIGMAQSTLTSIFQRGNKNAIPPFAESVLGIYADVREEWLLHGEEPMLRSQLEQGGFAALHEIIHNLSETVRQPQDTISQLTRQ